MVVIRIVERGTPCKTHMLKFILLCPFKVTFECELLAVNHDYADGTDGRTDARPYYVHYDAIYCITVVNNR